MVTARNTEYMGADISNVVMEFVQVLFSLIVSILLVKLESESSAEVWMGVRVVRLRRYKNIKKNSLGE